MGFEKTTFGEYAKVQGGNAYKSKDFIEKSLNKVLKIKNVRFGTVSYDDSGYISDELAQATIAWQAKEGDILISMTGSGPNAPQSLVGRVARVWKGEPASWINQRVGRIQLKNEGSIHPDFLFYLLSLPQSQEFLVSNSSGSANQANISGKIIEMLPCPKISFNQSQYIAEIGRSLDEKIILNRQTNQTLEQMAQTLFKSWFVDFDPVFDNLLAKANYQLENLPADFPEELCPKAVTRLAALSARTTALEHESERLASGNEIDNAALPHPDFPSAFEYNEQLGWVPLEWDVKSVSEAIKVNPRTTLSKGSIATFADMKAIPTSGYMVDEVIEKEYKGGAKFKKNDVLFARITPCLQNGKTALVDFLSDNEVGFGSTEFIVFREGHKINYPYIACLAREENFRAHCMQSMVGSSGRQRVQNACFDDYYLAVPNESSVLNKFSNYSAGGEYIRQYAI